MPPALRCIPGPSANRAKSLINFWHPRSTRHHCIFTRGVTSLLLHLHRSKKQWEERPWTSQQAFGVQRSQSVRGFLVGAVLSCSPGPYTEFCVQQQAVAAAVVLCGEYLTLGSSLQHHEAFSDWPASVVSLFSPGGSWGGKAVLGKSCHMLAVGSRPAAFWLSSVTVRAHYRHSPTGGNPVSHRVNIHHFLESLCWATKIHSEALGSFMHSRDFARHSCGRNAG